jgi:peptide-methionine (S)-S-oxide reductase
MRKSMVVPAVVALVMSLGCGGAPRSEAGSSAAKGAASQPSGAGTEPAISLPPDADGAAGVPVLTPAPASKHPGMASLPPLGPNQDIAIFAGGCFWCMEKPFEKLKGVKAVISGYTDGHTADPTYDLVNTHTTGHVEAVWIAFDSTEIGYPELLKVFWHNVDPTTDDRQFCDAADTYVSRIFWRTPAQRAQAEASRIKAAAELQVKEPILTAIVPAALFWPAEEYHQDYYKKNPVHYEGYRLGCGRDARLKKLWGDAAKH